MSTDAGKREPSALAEQLEELKQRSGRSYAALAHRTGLSRSSLHRYCQGTTVPGTFGAVERIARVCGADEAELDRLYRAWRKVVAEQEESGAGQGESSPSSDGSAAATSAVGAARDQAPVITPPLRTYFRLRAAILLIALVATSVVSVTSYDGSWGRGARTDVLSRTTDEQAFRGPLWSIAPRPVGREFFGQTLNTDTGSMPGFPTGSARLWNSHTRWGNIEGERRHYDWSILDRMVKSAERDRLPVLFTFGGTPLWAAPEGRKSFFNESSSSPPDNLADWDHFVEKVAKRYRGRIGSYELWDYPSDKGMYAGRLSTLAEMVERAARVIRRVDPEAQIACPSFGSLWSKRGRELLRKFIRTGAYESCDAAALKMPPREPAGPPEEFIELSRRVHELFYEEGAPEVSLWNTGPDRDVNLARPLDARHARDYAVRFYLAGLYSRFYGVRRMYFYAWGSTGLPLVVQPVGGRPTEAGLRIGRLTRWLSGARIGSCGEGRRMGLAEGAYTCRFVRDGKPLVVVWTARGRGQVTLDEGAFRLRHMDGSTVRARPGERVGFGQEPVLIEYGPK